MKLPIKIHRLVLFIILYSLFFILFSAPVLAQAKTQQVNQYPTPNTNSDVPNNLHNWTQNVMIEVMSAMTCQIAGIDPVNPKQQCLGIDQKSGKIGFVQSGGGAIGVMGNMISVLYTPPAHTADYFRNLAANFGIAKKAYAQGTGFDSLQPLMNIWIAFRNIVYIIFVIVFVVIGIAIMFRFKIDPRTVMSIQNQIPKIIIGILLVTFSFAIAGFLIDLMWVFIYLMYGIFSGIQVIDPNTGKNILDLSNLNPVTIQGQNALRVAEDISRGGIWGITWTVANSVKDALKNLIGVTGCTSIAHCFNDLFNPINFVFDPKERSVFNILFNLISGATGGAAFFKIVSVPLPNLGEGIPGISAFFQLAAESGKLTAAIAAATGVYAGTQFLLREFLPLLIAYLIIFIALLTALIRLWFTLLMSYVYILLDIVLAPFWIIAGALPGSPISFTGWLRDIGANLIAFPATIAMFMLGKVFMDSFGKTPIPGTQNFVPPLIGNPGDPSAIGALIGLGILLMTPNVVNMLKQMLKAPKLDMGGIGASLRAGAGVPMGGIKTGVGIYTTSKYNPLTGMQFTGDEARKGMLGRMLGRLIR